MDIASDQPTVSPAQKARAGWPPELRYDYYKLRFARLAADPQNYPGENTGAERKGDKPKAVSPGIIPGFDHNHTSYFSQEAFDMTDFDSDDGDALDADERAELQTVGAAGNPPPAGRDATFPDGVPLCGDLPQGVTMRRTNPAPHPPGYRPPVPTPDPTHQEMYLRERLLADSDGHRRALQDSVVKPGTRVAPSEDIARARISKLEAEVARLEPVHAELQEKFLAAQSDFEEATLTLGNTRQELSYARRALIVAERAGR